MNRRSFLRAAAAVSAPLVGVSTGAAQALRGAALEDPKGQQIP